MSIFIIPGSWHPAFTFDLLVSALKDTHKLEAFATTLPTTALPPSGSPPKTFADDVAHIRQILVPRIEAGEEFVVICHSYGGIPGSEALFGLGLAERKSAGKSGGVKRIVYMASFMLPEGVKLLEAFGGRGYAPWWDVNEDSGVVIALDTLRIFYNDVEPVLAESIASRLVPMSLSAFKTPQKHAAWRTIPSTYIFCELDNAIAPAMQESMIGGAGLDLKDVLRLKAGHSPFLSRADELAMIISNLVSESG